MKYISSKAKYNTKCTTSIGVGDDNETYGLDGYRMILWNGTQSFIKNIWDVGDIIGIAIDLDNAYIEYFINGIPIGAFAKNILIGPNQAYFPAVTMHSKERCIVFTGSSKLNYTYNSSLTNE